LGLFGSKTKTTVATTTSRVIEDALVPNSIKTGLLKSLLENGNTVDYVMEELVGSIGSKANRMYKYAKDNYTHGLPSGAYLRSNDCKDEVQAVLSSIEGTAITTTYCHYGPPNSSHIGWLKAIELYGLNTTTNELTVLTTAKAGKKCYMVDLQVVVPAADIDKINPKAIEQWGTSPSVGFTPKRSIGSLSLSNIGKYSAVIADAGATEDYFKLTYEWMVETTENGITKKAYFQESVTFLNNSYEDDANYFQARYVKNGLPKYFMYKDDSGTHPSLDEVFTTENTTAGTFFPFAYLRLNKASVIANKTTPAYLTSKKMVKYLGMDYDQLGEGVDANPDIADVEQAIIMMAVPANTENKAEIRYLFDFFKSLHSALPTTTVNDPVRAETLGVAGILSKLLGNTSVPSSAMVIQDKQFKMTLAHSGIFRRRLAGSIGPVGFCNTTVTTNISTTTFKNFAGSVITNDTPLKSHIYRRQTSLNTYEEIQVADLKVTYFIYGNYSVTADETDDILLIPVDKAITDAYPLRLREELLSRSLHYVFNSRVVTKIKWYQTGVFKVFLVIVAIAITYFTGGAAFETIAAALAAGELTVVALTILTLIIENIIISYAFKLFVKVLGVKLAFVVAIVAAVYGAYQMIEAGSVSGAPFAQELLQLSTGLSNAASAALQADFQDLLGDYTSFQKEMKEQLKTLDEAKALLDTSAHLSPFVIFGESPNEFYNRTIHAGNIGIAGLDSVTNYVDIALRLPDINDTINTGE